MAVLIQSKKHKINTDQVKFSMLIFKINTDLTFFESEIAK